MQSYLADRAEVEAWVEQLNREQPVVAPVKQFNSTRFQPIAAAADVVWGAPQSVTPPKQLFFPPAENLINFSITDQGIKSEAVIQATPTVLLGVHPCDLNGLYLLDQVFNEKYPDANYLEKRRVTTIIGVDCLELCAPESSCLRFGGLDPKGRFDILLTPQGEQFYLEVATDKGEKLRGKLGRTAKLAEVESLKALRQERDKRFDKQQKALQPKLSELPALLKKNYNHPLWEERGKKDYSCGSCNMVCPTCYCFDVQDYLDLSGTQGVRRRCWDGCMLEEFAAVGAGENFREDRSARLRHRTNRKLNYLQVKWGESFCTGCGRCAKACLTNIVNPLEIANELYGAGVK